MQWSLGEIRILLNFTEKLSATQKNSDHKVENKHGSCYNCRKKSTGETSKARARNRDCPIKLILNSL